MRSILSALVLAATAAAVQAQPVVIAGPPHIVVVPAPTVSVATRVVCRPATTEDFAPDLRVVNGVAVLAPKREAFAAGRCTSDTTTTVTRPLR